MFFNDLGELWICSKQKLIRGFLKSCRPLKALNTNAISNRGIHSFADMLCSADRLTDVCTNKHTFNPLHTEMQMIDILLSRYAELRQGGSKQTEIVRQLSLLDKWRNGLTRFFFGLYLPKDKAKSNWKPKKRKMLICCCSGQSHEASVLFPLPRLTADCKANVTQCILQFNNLAAFKSHLKALNYAEV